MYLSVYICVCIYIYIQKKDRHSITFQKYVGTEVFYLSVGLSLSLSRHPVNLPLSLSLSRMLEAPSASVT